MSELHINCPHCGSSFQVMVKGEPSNMMVFSCVKCKTPLMYYGGDTAELDREEFAGLRKKLSKVLDVVISNDSSVKEVADSLRSMVDASNAIAEERAEKAQESRRAEGPVSITDEALEQLQKDLAEMDVDKFLESL